MRKKKTNSRKDMNKHGLHYYAQLQKILDARETKSKDVLRRKQMLDHYNKQNYQLEYDRIRNLLHDKTIRGESLQMLKNRVAILEELGAKAINEIQ